MFTYMTCRLVIILFWRVPVPLLLTFLWPLQTGDANNVVNSWLRLAAVIPIHFTCCCPEEYQPDPATLKLAKDAGVSTILVSHNPQVTPSIPTGAVIKLLFRPPQP